MKNYSTLFIIFFMIPIILQAQQPPCSFEWGKRMMEDHPEKLYQHFDEPNYHPNQTLPQLFNADIPTLNAIIPDFQVNDYTGTDGGFQRDPAISTDADGTFVITWVDGRNGDSDIYAQRYSSDGTAVGTNFKVNNDVRNHRQDFPSVSSDNNGNFLIIWRELRSDGRDIYAQRYAHDGTVLGDNFRVNDVEGSALQYSQSTFIDNNGNLLIAWTDSRNGSGIFDIYAQRYSNDGSAIGTNFKVNDIQGVDTLPSISISADGSGNFVITWTHFLGGYDIYAKSYASDGTAFGDNFKVNDDLGNYDHYFPFVSTNSSGNFIITRVDGRNGALDIYAQHYERNGSALGKNFKVNDEQGQASFSEPSIFTDNSGNFIITWLSSNGTEDLHGCEKCDIYAQRYSSDGSASGTNFKVNLNFESVARLLYCSIDISISADGNGNFMIAWLDERGSDIYAQRNSSEGALLGTSFRVNDDAADTSPSAPAIATDSSGDFMITWEDRRNGENNIYAQRYAHDGSALGDNFKVNEYRESAWEYDPSIEIDNSGNVVITWECFFDGNYDIYAQRFSSDGNPLETNFKVNDDVGHSSQRSPSLSIAGNDNFVMTWLDQRNGHWDIYVQRYSSDGTILGNNFKVNDDGARVRQRSPSISTDRNGNFVIAWIDNRNYDSNYTDDIYAQRYSSDGIVLGDNFKINDDQGEPWTYGEPSISMDNSGNFVIAWTDERNGWPPDIYAQRYSSDGTAMGDNFKVNDGDLGWRPSISMDNNGNFVVMWEDNGIYAQRYLSGGTALGSNYRVTNPPTTANLLLMSN